ncbi:MAG: SAM-dependent methyltransferase, partial [Eudoraea sp.]|nr:SAM-dependent methyltransferase [Eudoraea sp.]
EHIPDDNKAMQELFRVMKPGGWGVFQVPQDLGRKQTFEDPSITDKKERAKIFGQYDHVRIYGYDYFERLRAIGFKVEEVDYTAEIPQSEVDRFRLAKGELIPLVKKS